MNVIFDRALLRRGDWLHVRGTSFVARFIRRGLNRMVRRLCKALGIPVVKVWGNHDGIFIKCGNQWYIGEALGSGNKLTRLSVYEKSISAGKEQVKVYRVCPPDEYDDAKRIGKYAAHNWLEHIQKTRYDYRGLFCLWLKSLFPFIKRMREWEWANWCTEGVGKSFRDWSPPVFDIMQTRYPTPMTVEQCAGELPRKPGKLTTLVDITNDVLKTASEQL